ncbi:hypothetical protein [Halalkalibacter krulwichiae]|uniref:Uncharacterized protein n=1 Tax=Halalkalibacter krulwichiae TaxID=199441 RepID=A0A1X9MJU9_9BACI|nr:hypothetical protein [Halalkalibacter krulwichiae]ARK32563.1 hypothetical protein BkAM31D_23330 [Halalkalibacter krulwichiae]
MDILLLVTIGFILIGFVVLISLKKNMERKLAFIKANPQSGERTSKTKAVVWWIVSTVAWGMVSIGLIILSFHNYFG